MFKKNLKGSHKKTFKNGSPFLAFPVYGNVNFEKSSRLSSEFYTCINQLQPLNSDFWFMQCYKLIDDGEQPFKEIV